MKTTLHTYHFSMGDPKEAEQYESLVRRLSAQGLKCFESYGGLSHYCPDWSGAVTLETKHVFNNQWNASRENHEQVRRAFDSNTAKALRQQLVSFPYKFEIKEA